MLETEHPYFAFIKKNKKQRKKNISLSESELFSMKILTFSKTKRKLILSLVSFQKHKEKKKGETK